MAEQCFGTGSRRLENSKAARTVEEKTGDAAGTRKTGRIISWKGVEGGGGAEKAGGVLEEMDGGAHESNPALGVGLSEWSPSA